MTKKTFLPTMLPVLAALLSISLLLPAPASALVTAFRQAIAEGVAEHEDMAEFYRDRAFAPDLDPYRGCRAAQCAADGAGRGGQPWSARRPL